MKKTHLLFLLAAPLFAILLVGVQVYYNAVVWKYNGPEVIFQIKPQETFSTINARLSNDKLISSARLFHRYSQWKGTMTKFKAGRYVIPTGVNLLTVYNILMNEKSLTVSFTIPEGKNMYEIGAMLDERSITHYADFIKLATDPDFVESLGIKGPSIEGYLYPETYNLDINLPADQVIKTMVREFNRKVNVLDFSNHMLSKEEIITLASIVEKETGDESERPIIAGVFLNRLKKKMRLQSDPTTIYGMFENFTGSISKKDLQTPSDYNTYTIKALPIGPIANPGLEAIQAVLAPANHNYYFFVSQNDGTHVFSEKYSDHVNAVNTWQKNPKNREGKSWRNKKKVEKSTDLTGQVTE